MKKHIYNYMGDKLIRIEEATPVCGHDFCDTCGDCLACDGEGPCYGSFRAEEHRWVQYGEKEEGK